MTKEEQLAKWVEGESIHDREIDECCPDFSCCRPELLADQKVREKFAAADEESRMGMLGHFLSVAISTYDPDKAIYIAGTGEPI